MENSLVMAIVFIVVNRILVVVVKTIELWWWRRKIKLWRRGREIKIVEEEKGNKIFTQNLCVVVFLAPSLTCTIYESVNQK